MCRKLLFIFPALFLLFASLLQAKSLMLSDKAVVSILTCGPNKEIYALYGHTAIRVSDPVRNIDLAFNYGVFSFDKPNFIYRFAKGETDYLLYPYQFLDFFSGYQKDQRSVYEQVLNLTQKEKQQLFDFLIWNAREENREYRYNFFFDNCASRVRDVVEKQVEGEIIFPEKSDNPKTFRQLIKMYHRRDRWLNFGIDLVVCAPADRFATPYEEMFLPGYLMAHFARAQIQDENGNKPLVTETRTLFETTLPKQSPAFSIASPGIVFLLIVLLVVCISVCQFRKSKIPAGADYLVYGVNGLMGLILLWFVLYSEHPAMSPNYNLVWAMPLNLLFAVVWAVKKWRPVTRWYHVFMLVWMLLFVIFGSLLPQSFHPVFYLFVLMVLSRAALHSIFVFRKKKEQD
ncbi:MAG: DUF4105 domain-containing protein [Prolixibacteraceae bacterium]|jgi:hypothetical protein|nr:DUF4105 domain-containing protein [Prolixibacteraceae bacterium]